MSDNVIEAQNLTKRRGQTTVVKDISFSVGLGEIFGLLKGVYSLTRASEVRFRGQTGRVLAHPEL
jgi:ABC-type transporter Mla maintaining outer membrane lipid asymmetry ATPase subunit MlaF